MAAAIGHAPIELIKHAILLAMLLVTASSLWLSWLLHSLLAPLRRSLSLLHRPPLTPESSDLRETGPLETGPIAAASQPPSSPQDRALAAIQQRYIDLFQHVDQVDAAAFSAGEIETLPLRFLGRNVTAADAQRWLQQAPGLLISLGLLGTFLGLSVGLGQISGVLATSNSADAIRALQDILAPMGTAFQTSLAGLSLSLLVLIFSQLNGSREGLEACEALLTSWLETVVPQQLGHKLNTPLRQSIQALNASLAHLPHAVYAAVETGMQTAFADKLDALFDTNANLASEAQTAIRQIGEIANALQQSGEDFLLASQAFRDTNFAVSLRQSAEHLQASGEQLRHSSETLSQRLLDVRDNLLSTQAEWFALAQAASQELQASRALAEQLHRTIPPLQSASTSLQAGNETLSEASNQLRKARLEVGRDRRLAIDVAQLLRTRLNADASLSDSCQSIASSVERSLSTWERHQIELSGLERQIVSLNQPLRCLDQHLESLLGTLATQQQQLLNQSLWPASPWSGAWRDSDDFAVSFEPIGDQDPIQSIVAEYQLALFRDDRSFFRTNAAQGLGVISDSVNVHKSSSANPIELGIAGRGGAFFLVQRGGKSWVIPGFHALDSFTSLQPSQRIFSYNREDVVAAELRRPAEVRQVGDRWQVVNMGVIAVPAKSIRESEPSETPDQGNDQSRSIVDEYKTACSRRDRSLLRQLYWQELKIAEESEQALQNFTAQQTILEAVGSGGSYLLIPANDRTDHAWIVPDWQTLGSYSNSPINKGVFSYDYVAGLGSPELRQPAEVKQVGDRWQVVNMGVIAVPG